LVLVLNCQINNLSLAPTFPVLPGATRPGMVFLHSAREVLNERVKHIMSVNPTWALPRASRLCRSICVLVTSMQLLSAQARPVPVHIQHAAQFTAVWMASLSFRQLNPSYEINAQNKSNATAGQIGRYLVQGLTKLSSQLVSPHALVPAYLIYLNPEIIEQNQFDFPYHQVPRTTLDALALYRYATLHEAQTREPNVTASAASLASITGSLRAAGLLLPYIDPGQNYRQPLFPHDQGPYDPRRFARTWLANQAANGVRDLAIHGLVDSMADLIYSARLGFQSLRENSPAYYGGYGTMLGFTASRAAVTVAGSFTFGACAVLMAHAFPAAAFSAMPLAPCYLLRQGARTGMRAALVYANTPANGDWRAAFWAAERYKLPYDLATGALRQRWWATTPASYMFGEGAARFAPRALWPMLGGFQALPQEDIEMGEL
jgi:hypothetical protein